MLARGGPCPPPGDADRDQQTREEYATYWNTVEAAIAQHNEGSPAILLADASASQGSTTSPQVGVGCAPEPEGFAGACVRGFLREKDLCLPTTLRDGTADQATWFSADGRAGHRFDYVGLPSPWLRMVRWAAPCDSADLSLERLDHKAVEVHLVGQFVGGPSAVAPPSVKFDRRKLERPEVAAAISMDLSTLPLPPGGSASRPAKRTSSSKSAASWQPTPRANRRRQRQGGSSRAHGHSWTRAGARRARAEEWTCWRDAPSDCRCSRRGS